MMNQFKLTVIALILGVSASAQQLEVLNFGIINPFSYNPSQAGLSGNNNLFLHQRLQWVGVEGAPKTSRINGDWMMPGSNNAMGISISNHFANIINSTQIAGAYAKHLKINEDHHLSLGLMAGLNFTSIAFNQLEVEDQADNSILSNAKTGTLFDANFGATYSFKGFQAELVGFQLLESRSRFENSIEDKAYEYNLVRHYLMSLAYSKNINDDIQITPIIRFVGVQGLPFRTDFIVKGDYKETITAALHYKHKRSFAVVAMYQLNETFGMGYSSEFSTQKMASNLGTSHEIVVAIRFK